MRCNTGYYGDLISNELGGLGSVRWLFSAGKESMIQRKTVHSLIKCHESSVHNILAMLLSEILLFFSHSLKLLAVMAILHSEVALFLGCTLFIKLWFSVIYVCRGLSGML